MSEANYPYLPESDNRTALVDDLTQGGIWGYAHARGIDTDYKSTLDFEGDVLIDVMMRTTAISYRESCEDRAVTIKLLKELISKTYAIALDVIGKVPAKHVSIEHLERMNAIHGELADMGIEV